VNLLLSVVTLGVYSAWAKERRELYLHRNTRIADASFGHYASPIAILRARAIQPSRLTALLERLDADSERNPLGAASAYLSTHPMTDERIHELETP
jgi:hypothetical protein